MKKEIALRKIMSDFNSWEKGLFSVVGVPGGPLSTDTTHWYRRDEYPKLNKDSPYSDTDITYVWNRYGFRSDEFDDDGRGSIMVFGCSYTLGIGCPIEHTWPHILKNKLNPKLKVYNISMAAASSDFISRALYKTVDILRPTAIFILWPRHPAREIPFKGQYIPFKITTLEQVEFRGNNKKLFGAYNPLFADYSFFMYHQRKNEILVKSICAEKNIPIQWLTVSVEEDLDNPNFFQLISNVENFNNDKAAIRRIGYQFNFPLARDNYHLGKEGNEYIANLFYERYKSYLD